MKRAILLGILGLSLQAACQQHESWEEPSHACPPGQSRIATAYGSYCSPGVPLRSSPVAEQTPNHESLKTEPQLSPLPKIADVEMAGKAMHLTLTKCEADASAYSDSPTAELISSISDARLHELNTEAFACMRLGGPNAQYGYQLKTIVDAAYTAHALVIAFHSKSQEDAKIASDMAGKLVDDYNVLVRKHNDLVFKYNSLLSSTQAVESYANQLRQTNAQLLAIATLAIGESSVSRYPPPQPVSMPSTIYVRQSPLTCSSVAQPTITGQVFTSTHCY